MSNEVLKQNKEISAERNYNQISDARAGVRRLIDSFSNDKRAEANMFVLLEQALDLEPELSMNIIRGSIGVAKEKLGQNRESGSSATLYYPIETSAKIVAKREDLLQNPFSSKSWDLSTLVTVFKKYSKEIIELAGSNTTSLNLPQRAGHILWMIDQVDSIPEPSSFAFLEIGASAGLILDGLTNPEKFLNWMKDSGYRTDYGEKTTSTINSALGIDLVIPSQEWTRAVVPGDTLRNEVSDFMSKFSRSKIIEADATKLDQNNEVINHFQNSNRIPFLYSCAAFYQMPEQVRNGIRESARTLLKRLGGGYLMITDFASNMGFPNIKVGSVSWAENQDGVIVSPKIFISDQTLTTWKHVSDTENQI